jgi:hypothetical protein
MVGLLFKLAELAHIELLVAGVEPDNVGSVRALLKTGFQALDPNPDFEGVVYFAWKRPYSAPGGRREGPGQSPGPLLLADAPGQAKTPYTTRLYAQTLTRRCAVRLLRTAGLA